MRECHTEFKIHIYSSSILTQNVNKWMRVAFCERIEEKNASNYAGVSYRHLTWLINKEIHDRRSMEERERNREEKIRNSLFCDDQHYYIDHWWGILYLFKFFFVCLPVLSRSFLMRITNWGRTRSEMRSFVMFRKHVEKRFCP